MGALTGKALTLIELDRNEEAQEVLRAALRINPWLAERALLDGPLDRDI
ncbi:tetratricopeptide repeat protein [Pseudooctadecabacter sp.]